jgi:hypothetical protein
MATNLLAKLTACHSNRGWQWIKRLTDLGLNIQQGPKARPQLQRQLADLLLPIVDFSAGAGGRAGARGNVGQLVQLQAVARVLWNMARRCKVRPLWAQLPLMDCLSSAVCANVFHLHCLVQAGMLTLFALTAAGLEDGQFQNTRRSH